MSDSNLFDPQVIFNPDVLRWARKSRNLSLEEVAQRMKVTIDDVKDWERGGASPAYEKLEILARKIYERPLALFFFPEVPDEEEIKRSFRTLPETELQCLSPGMISLMRKARTLQLNLSELYEGRNSSARPIWRSLRFRRSDNPEDVAKEARRFLRVDLSEQQDWKGEVAALNHWRRALEDCGVFVFKDSFKSSDNKQEEKSQSGESVFSGFCLHDDEFPIIYVNNNHAKTRQIFTLFHELAHLLMGESGVLPDYGREIVYSNNARWIERSCNRFAAELLVPAEDFKARFKEDDVNDKTIKKWAAFYSVSRATILHRLCDWEFASWQYYDKKVQQWQRQFLKEKQKLRERQNQRKKEGKGGGPNPYQTKITYLGETYVEAVFERYQQYHISVEEAADYLDIKVKNIFKLEEKLLSKHNRTAG